MYFLHLPEDHRSILQTSLAVSNKPENGQYIHFFVNEKEGYEKYSRLISRYISRDNGVCSFLSKKRNFRDNSEIQIRSTIRTNIKLIFYGKEETRNMARIN